LQEIASIPVVTAAQKIRFYLLRNQFVPLTPDAGEGVFFVADARSPERVGPPMDLYKVLEGRAPDPTRPDEAVIALPGASVTGFHVGASFKLGGFTDFFPDFGAAARKRPLTIHIVGRVAAPGDFPPQSGDETVHLHLTPAFYDRYPEQDFGFPGGFLLKLRGGEAGADSYRAALAGLGGDPGVTLERGLQDANTQRSIHLQALALWLLAGLTGLAFILIFGQTLARQVFLEADDYPILRALGFTRGQLFASTIVRTIAVAALGAFLAAGVAIAFSPLTQTGLGRTAEPSPGLAVDVTVIGLGALAVIAGVALLAMWPAWRAAGSRTIAADETLQRPSAFAEALARAGRLPSAIAGTRLALERGRGRGSLPVRSTVAALTLGLFVLWTTATFDNSLHHLLASPRLYGETWDARVGVETEIDLAAVGRRLASDPGVEGVSVGRVGFSMAIGNLLLEGLEMAPVAGRAPLPPVTSGRLPRTQPKGQIQEIALGTRALARAHAHIDDVVTVNSLESGTSASLKIVGTAVIPAFNDSTRLGDGVLMTPEAVRDTTRLPLDNENIRLGDLFVKGTVDLDRITALVGHGAQKTQDVHIWPAVRPADVVNFGRVENMPLFLGEVLGLFAAATLVHTLITSISRRRRELAILKTLGFVRKQVKRAVRVQALLLTSIALVISVPAGIAAGRWLWSFFATQQGVIAEPDIQPAALFIGIPLILVAAILIAAIPARAAARTQPALVLRSE
jgi:ABC-type lipoprotein release transport system permease subunit